MKKTAWGTVLAVAAAFAAHGAADVRGALCLTFDDRNFDAWERCLPLFAKYGAHATFFVCGPIDARAEACMRRLAAAGHSIGLHGFRHRKAPEALAQMGEEGYVKEELAPQLEVCRAKGLAVKSFAYPMSTRTPATDALLLRHFARLRSGCGRPMPFPRAKAAEHRVHMGWCGTHPRDVTDRIAALLPQIAAGGTVLTVYAHNIEAKGAPHDIHNITEEDLEKLLAAARNAGVAILGFDEL